MDYSKLLKNEEYSSSNNSVLRPPATAEAELGWLAEPTSALSYQRSSQQTYPQLRSAYSSPVTETHLLQFCRSLEAQSSVVQTSLASQTADHSDRKDTPKPKTDYRTVFKVSHSQYLYRLIRELYLHTRVLDVYFLVGRQYIGAHFCLLACASPMLKDLLLQVTGDSMFISVPDVSSAALESLIYFLYNGNLKNHSTNIEEVIDAAKYLGMSEVALLLQQYYSLVGSKENSTTVAPNKMAENHAHCVDDKPAESSNTEVKTCSGNKLEKIFQQKLPAVIAHQPEAHCSALASGTGILSELLTKPEFNRVNNRLPGYFSGETNKLVAPLNLSTAKGSARQSITSPKQGSQSVYLGQAGSLPEVPYFHYSRTTEDTTNCLAGLAANNVPINYGLSASKPSHPTVNATSSNLLKVTNSKNKHKKDSHRSAATNKQTTAPIYGSSQHLNPFYNPLFNGLTNPLTPHINFNSFLPYNSLAMAAGINISKVFPHLLQSAGDLLRTPEKTSSAVLPERKLPPGISISSITPPKQHPGALNLSFSPSSRDVSTPLRTIVRETVTLDSPSEIKTSESDKIEIASNSSLSAQTVVASIREQKSPVAGPSHSTIDSSHTDTYTQTAGFPTMSLGLCNFKETDLGSSTKNPYEALRNTLLAYPTSYPSTTIGNCSSHEPVYSSSAEKLRSSPIDLSRIAQGRNFRSTLREGNNTSESADIDVVGSPFSEHGEEPESILSDHSLSNFQESPLTAVNFCVLKDSKPATPESVEVIEETLLPEKLPVVQRRPLQQSVNMGRKRKGCGECDGCQVSDDCGNCKFCKDKSKFGGPNRLKQVCEQKRCSDLHSESNDARKRRRLLNKKKQSKCGNCTGCRRETDCGECYSCLSNNNVAQPPSRKKICEMRACEEEEAKAILNVPEEPSQYSHDYFRASGSSMFVTSTSDMESNGSIKFRANKDIKKRSPYRRENPSKVRTKYYCGVCPGCTTGSPCGKCVYCEDMPKFGGRGKYRQKCSKQLCDTHPRLQALKNSSRNKPDDLVEEANRQRILVGAASDPNSSTANSESRSLDDVRIEEHSSDFNIEPSKPEPHHLLHLFQSISHQKPNQILSGPLPVITDFQKSVVAQLIINQSELHPEADHLKPISKLHIKKCDEVSSSRWQIQNISPDNNISDDRTEQDLVSPVAIDLSSNSEERIVQSVTCAEKVIADKHFICETADQTAMATDNLESKEDIGNIDSTDVNIDSKHSLQSSEEFIADNVDVIVPMVEDHLKEEVNSDSSMVSLHSCPSPKIRGRGRSRGRGKGRGKSPVGVKGLARKRGRRRKTPRFIIDPEDHSDFEDVYEFQDNFMFEDAKLQSYNSNSISLKRLQQDERTRNSISRIEIERGENSMVCKQNTDSEKSSNFSLIKLNNPSNSDLRPPISSKCYSGTAHCSSDPENDSMASANLKSDLSMHPYPSSIPSTNFGQSLVSPSAGKVQAGVSRENDVSSDLSTCNEAIPSPNNSTHPSHQSLDVAAENSSYNAHISCASGTRFENLCAKVCDENENVDVSHV